MTAGSRGDVAPYTGLGHGLRAAGHDVTVVTHERFEGLVRAAGVGFHALPVDPRAELASASGQGLHRSRSAAGKMVRLLAMARALVGEMAEGLMTAAEANDLLLLSGSVAQIGQTLGEGLGLPTMGAYLQPLAPTREFAPPVLGSRSWGTVANRAGARALNSALDLIFTDACRTLRARMGLHRKAVGAVRRAHDRDGWPVVHGFSPYVLPRPRDWRPGLTVTGYWWPYDGPDVQLPPRVEEFLAAGPPPVFVGLGSATVPDADRFSRTVVGALRAAGVRGVIQRGWSGLHAGRPDDAGAPITVRDTAVGGSPAPAASPTASPYDDMLVVDEVPHSLLFPRMAAVVHHAGAGTTAAGLRAGVPAVPVPIQFDAAFWSQRLLRLGVAPRPVPLRTLTADTLAAAVHRAVRDPRYAQRAAAVGERIRAEDGVRPVREAIDQLTGGSPLPTSGS